MCLCFGVLVVKYFVNFVDLFVLGIFSIVDYEGVSHSIHSLIQVASALARESAISRAIKIVAVH